MDYPILHAKVVNLNEGETAIITFRDKDEFSGVLKIGYDYKFCDQGRINQIKTVLKMIAEYVTDINIR